MKTTTPVWTRFACAAALAALTWASAADEAEIFVGTGNAVSNTRPNILFIMDTSGSMTGTITTQVPFDPAVTFPTGTGANNCRTDRVYFERNGTSSDPPSCRESDNNWIPLSAFKCKAGLDSMAITGYYIANPAAQWRSNRWQSINGGTGASAWVECKADEGVHGNGVDTNRLWAADGGNGPWSANQNQKITWTANNSGRSYAFYSGNYVNWLRNGSTITQTRLQIMQQVATTTVNQLAAQGAVNIGLMRFSNNNGDGDGCDQAAAEGGMVVREMGPVETNAALVTADIAALTADGCTPLSETMFEAYRYLSGGGVRYGINSRRTPNSGGAMPSVSTSRQPSPNQNTYQSPLTISCERNFIVLLTDGLPTADGSANADIQTLIGGNCAYPTDESSTEGRCLEEIARYMYENDIRPTLADTQNVTTYTVGFALTGTAGAAAVAKLRATAIGAGGTFYEAKDTASLTIVLTNIVRTILDFNTSFTAPAVSVNAFNRTQNLDEIFVTVFNPSETYNWQGNVKKYKVIGNGTIVDANNNPAVELTTGFFRANSQSFWSAGIDGDDVGLGGAANELPNPIPRKLYSDLNTAVALTATGNEVNTANTAITNALLGLSATEAPGRDALINWMRGQDIADADGDGVTTDARLQMGDPMNGRPATVIYGGTVANPDPNDGVVFAVTNEGYLHAINAVDGTELWAYVPRQLLSRASDLYNNEAVNNRTYGLDANIVVVKNEVNSNGVIEAGLGERVLIYFGMRRGGNDYFALDVTDRNAPTLLWRIGPNEAGTKRLPNAGQSWSTPTLARVNINGASQNALKQVLVFGGGYDTVQDNGGYAVDSVGNQIFMVDALLGDVLWYAGPSTDAGADLRHAAMTHSIPGDVRIFDLSGDGFADRMYAATMGGRVWRFDIHNGQTRANLVTGGVFASLGNAHLATHPVESTRRFYNAPSVAFLSSGGRSWLNVALGSGYRGHPLNVQAQDRFYALRDHQPFARLTQAQYDAATVITEADVNLIDVSTDITPDIPPGASGWRFDLKRPASADWTGEKSLSEALTVASNIQFTTYEPHGDSTSSSTSCAPAAGVNRLYTVSALTGAPVYDRESPTDPEDPEHEEPDSPDDREIELSQAGIAPEVVHLFLPETVCLVGLEACDPMPDRVPIRTFWRQTGVN